LSEWVAPATLVAWVKELVENIDRNQPEGKEFFPPTSDSRRKELLHVVLYAYATQVYGSQEIAEACHTDPVLETLCNRQPPFSRDLEHFRRTHRTLLESLLGQIFLRAVSEKFVHVGALPPGFQQSLLRRAVDSIDTARHMDRDE